MVPPACFLSTGERHEALTEEQMDKATTQLAKDTASKRYVARMRRDVDRLGYEDAHNLAIDDAQSVALKALGKPTDANALLALQIAIAVAGEYALKVLAGHESSADHA